MQATVRIAILKGLGETVTFSWVEGDDSVRVATEYADGTQFSSTHDIEVARETWKSLTGKGYHRIGTP